MVFVAPMPPGLAEPVREALESARRAVPHLDAVLRHARDAWRMSLDMPRLERAAAGHALILALHRSGRLEEVCTVAAEVLPALREYADAPFGAAYSEALRCAAVAAAETGRFTDALALATELHGYVQSRELDDERASALSLLGVAFDRSGDPWQAARILREGAAEARRRGGDRARLLALNNLAVILLSQYDLFREAGEAREGDAIVHEALQVIEEAAPIAKRFGDGYLESMVLSNLGEIQAVLGMTDEAERTLDRAQRIAQEGPYEAMASRIAYARGDLALRRDDPRTAIKWLTEAQKALVLSPVETSAVMVSRALYRAYRQLGDASTALAMLEQTRTMELARARRQLQARSEYTLSRVEAEERQRRTLDDAYRVAQESAQRAEAMERLALQDALTGLANRRALVAHLDRVLERAAIRHQEVSVILIDLDHFKQINDRFGHAVGDRVLQRVATLLRDRVQPGLVARPGGEEFVIVLENVNATHAVTLCEELRLMVAHHPWHTIADGLVVTLSAGIASYPYVTPGELLEQADLQMYRAKRMGRNRVSVVP